MLTEDNAKNGKTIGLNIEKLGTLCVDKAGIFDNYNVKRQFISITSTLAQQLLL